MASIMHLSTKLETRISSKVLDYNHVISTKIIRVTLMIEKQRYLYAVLESKVHNEKNKCIFRGTKTANNAHLA